MTDSITLIRTDVMVEACLAEVAAPIGADLPGYRGHVYRVFTYAMHFLKGESRWRRPVGYALAFHDVGLWTDKNLAYLEPSEAVAERLRPKLGADLDPVLIRNIIHWHHKVTAFLGPDADVVNAVRKGDWIDASGGMLRKGLSKAQVATVTAEIPAPGFQQTLMRLADDLHPAGQAAGLGRVLSKVYKL